jgi:hypothetical protein
VVRLEVVSETSLSAKATVGTHHGPPPGWLPALDTRFLGLDGWGPAHLVGSQIVVRVLVRSRLRNDPQL